MKITSNLEDQNSICEHLFNKLDKRLCFALFFLLFDFRSECTSKLGVSVGSCANSFGVCCTCKSYVFVRNENLVWHHRKTVLIHYF